LIWDDGEMGSLGSLGDGEMGSLGSLGDGEMGCSTDDVRDSSGC
jgi:hypothetical protein